jgi:S-adenosylmethionine synthetase
MKITINFSDSLLDAAKRAAASQATTVEALVERGLRHVLGEEQRKAKFRLRKASIKGRGMQPGIRDGSWEQIRDIAYEGRGG